MCCIALCSAEEARKGVPVSPVQLLYEWEPTIKVKKLRLVPICILARSFGMLGFILVTLGLKFSDPFLCLKAVLLTVSSCAKHLTSQAIRPFVEDHRK